MVIIRFSRPYASRLSPIVIRFGGDIEPPLPIDNSIGIECGMVWRKPIAIEKQTVLTEVASHLGIELDVSWTLNNGTEQTIMSAWASKASEGISYGLSWKVLPLTRKDFAISWALPTSHQTSIDILWKTTIIHQTDTVMRWLDVAAERLSVSLIWHDGAAQHIQHTLRYKGIRSGTEHLLKWGPHAARWICSTKYRPPVGVVSIRFNDPFTPLTSAAVNPIIIRFTPSPEYCYFDDGGGLIDSNPVLPNLDFKTPIEPQLRRYYLMQPTITCIRLSDNVPIVISNISISRSRGQWASSVSIDFSSRIDACRAENQLLKVGINGYEFYVLLEQTSVNKVFGNATYRGTGRSRSAELTTPYVLPISYTNSTSRSYAGLLSDMLQFTGWTIELNGIVDFNVPAGAFSVGNKSPIDAVQEAVTQLGCMLLSDDETKALTVVPRWPTVPWLMDTATPDLTLHDAVITSYSESKEIGTECNVVWLRGEQQGISAKVKRAGTAGNIATDDISAQLIVDNQAARTAGTNALADTGSKLNINMSLPILADLPPATPGMLIGVREGVNVFKGTCDSVTISASVSDTGDIDVEQTITVVRHVA
ncbi:hypothetical protein FJ709_02985 [Shewanella glacialimarina]|nr:hypothetical protein FJ709_02985 [Shewanella glacialimarina]